MAKEIWKDIKKYEGIYQVSNLGRIKSLERKVRHREGFKLVKAKFLSLCYDKDKYLVIGLWKNGIRINYKVHRLVASEFILNDKNKPSINHKDCNKNNNLVDNLEWVTPKENKIHAKFMGLLPVGESNGASKLNRKDIINIRNDKRNNILISKDYDVTPKNIWYIKANKTWSHI